MTDKVLALRLLGRMFEALCKEPCEYFSCGLIDEDLFKWRCTIIGPAGSNYEGGMFPAELVFDERFPNYPPKMRFLCPMWHPNIDANSGAVCISILHEPGPDKYEYESAQERWLPIHTVESIVVSVVSMLLDPTGMSPLNVEAARDLREDRAGYEKKVRRYTERSIDYC